MSGDDLENIFKALPVIEADDLFRSLENFDGALDLAFGDLDVAPSEPPISLLERLSELEKRQSLVEGDVNELKGTVPRLAGLESYVKNFAEHFSAFVGSTTSSFEALAGKETSTRFINKRVAFINKPEPTLEKNAEQLAKKHKLESPPSSGRARQGQCIWATNKAIFKGNGEQKFDLSS